MTKENNINSKEGFTIIEVVLVLAIAGLIFLMVFVALPALQRSQRDTARRNDLARVDTSLTQYQTNNQNTNNNTNLPTEGVVAPQANSSSYPEGCQSNSACMFIMRYMNAGDSDAATINEFEDADGTVYGLSITAYGNEVKKPSDGATYGLNYVSGTDGKNVYSYTGLNNMDHMIYIITSAMCSGETAVSGSKRDYAILYRLEGSGVYCIDNR